MGKLSNKVAIVTGGNSGIGLAAAKDLALEGAQVVITGRRQGAIDEALAQIGHGAVGIRGDVSSLDDMRALVSDVTQQFGGIDIIVANAGVVLLETFGSVKEESYDTQFDVVKGHYFLVQYALPHLRPGASVVMLGSVASSRAVVGHNAYGGAKAALLAFVRSWALDTKGQNIRFNVVIPGPVETPMFEKLGYSGDQLAEFRERIAANTPLGRPGQPSELAKAISFLASDDASFITGTELFVDGGRSAPVGGS